MLWVQKRPGRLPLLCFRLLNGTDRRANQHARSHRQTAIHSASLTLSWLSLFLLPLFHSQHTTGWISIVMCHVASHWLESITAGHSVSIGEDIYTSLLFVNHVQQEFIFRPLQCVFFLKRKKGNMKAIDMRSTLNVKCNKCPKKEFVSDADASLILWFLGVNNHSSFSLAYIS